MPVMAIGVNGRPYTVDDLGDMPDDGRRYELIDGMLLVSPAPDLRHQTIALELATKLKAVRPRGMHVVIAPFAVRASRVTELQPDILVGFRGDFTEKMLPVAPLLAVEILSPSTALIDMGTKRAVYERMGVNSYWVIDPAVPALTVFEFGDDGLYRQVAQVKGDEVFETTRPFAVRFTPAELLDDLS